ncbi:MAG: sodium:proton antiporter [Deltaproteobacteria bacterium]|nr:sodium:proton antiporter [Deltaproteobacteria bacterium]
MHPTFTIALALAAGVLAQSAARHLRVPGIVLLLLAGIGLGPDGLGWVQPRLLGDGLLAIVDIAVAVILFEGGLNLQISRLRREQAAIRRLITWGALVTLFGGMLACHYLLGWSWRTSVLFGSLIVVTGPTVIGPLVTELRLRPRVATVLEAEGVLIDPIGAILAVLVLEIAIAPNVDSMTAGGVGLVQRLAFGAVAGVAAGWLLARLLRVRRLVPEGHENIMVLAGVLLLFEGCEVLVTHSGILAVTMAGVVVGNIGTLVDRDLREFKDQLSVMLIGLLFVMLAADVRYEQVRMLGWPGLAVVITLVFVVRPLGVWLATLGSELSWRERVFVGWVAPRGIVAAAVASIVVVGIERAGIPGGLELRALVFLTIGLTVVQAGLTAGPVARWLDVRLPSRDGVAILSANALGIALAKALRDGGRSVVFLDSNPQKSRGVEEAGFSVVFGNAIQERTMQRARFERVEIVVALTGNKTLNGVFVSRAKENFGVPMGLVAATQTDGGLVAEMVEREEADVVFDGHHDMQRWDVRWRRGEVEMARRRFRTIPRPESDEAESEPEPPAVGERFVILAVDRAGHVSPMSMSFRPQKGDEAVVAIHVPERDEAHRVLETMGWFEVPQMLEAEDTSEAGARPGTRSRAAS